MKESCYGVNGLRHVIKWGQVQKRIDILMSPPFPGQTLKGSNFTHELTEAPNTSPDLTGNDCHGPSALLYKPTICLSVFLEGISLHHTSQTSLKLASRFFCFYCFVVVVVVFPVLEIKDITLSILGKHFATKL